MTFKYKLFILVSLLLTGGIALAQQPAPPTPPTPPGRPAPPTPPGLPAPPTPPGRPTLALRPVMGPAGLVDGLLYPPPPGLL